MYSETSLVRCTRAGIYIFILTIRRSNHNLKQTNKKTLREKEKLLVKSNFSFSPQCFSFDCIYRIISLLTHLQLLSANSFSLRRSKIYRLTLVMCTHTHGPARVYELPHNNEQSACEVEVRRFHCSSIIR